MPANIFAPEQALRCPYCHGEQEGEAQDYVPPRSVAHVEEQCTNCDQVFFVRRQSDGGIKVSSDFGLKDIYTERL